MGEGFVKLYSAILDSSIWSYDTETRIVWITLLAMADSDGFVHAALPGIANRARVSIEATEKALEIFQGPDEHSRSNEHDGRRITKDGRSWLILNFREHRERQVAEAERARKRKWWRENRGKKKTKDQQENTRRTSENLAKTSNLLDASRPIQRTEAYTETDSNTIEVRSSYLNKQIDLEVSNKKPPYSPPVGDEAREKSKYSDDFLDFWAAYPRKVGKGQAFKAWTRAKRNGMPKLAVILEAIKKQKKSKAWTKEGGEFIPHPTTWINGGRWDDSTEIEAEEEEFYDPLPYFDEVES